MSLPAAPPHWRPTLLTLLCALIGGLSFRSLAAPLPWLLGPMVACAAVNLATGCLRAPRSLRIGGQWVIGIVLGLYFTPAVTAQLLHQGGWILAGVLWAITLGLALALLMRRLTGVDWPTAFFATAIGGASEMLVQAERVGGHGATVAVAHSVRLMLVVVLIPFLYQALDLHGVDPYPSATVAVDPPGLLGLIVATGAGALLLDRLGWPNAWVIGPLLVAAAFTATGHHPSAVPAWLVAAGQLGIGLTLGTRFTPDFLSRALPTVVVSLGLTCIGLMACAAFAWGLGLASGIPTATLILATAPGGIAEMSLTARNLALGVPIVTAFHVIRMAVVVLSIGTIYRWTSRWLEAGRA